MSIFRRNTFAFAAASLLAACSGTGMPSAPGGTSVANSRLVAAPAASSLVLQTLDVPISQFPSAVSTLLTGIRGSLVTGIYDEASGVTGAVVYNRTSGAWTGIQFPLASSTAVYGPDVTSTSYRLVGSYQRAGSPDNHGFLYDASSNLYTTMDAPGSFCGSTPCNQTIVHSIYGNQTFKFVGNCDAVKAPSESPGIYPKSGHAFLYDSQTKKFTKIDVAGASSTTAYGIWINGTTVAIAGGFTNAKGTHAYVRNLAGKQQVVYDYPKAAITHFEGVTGAGPAGNYNVIGDYTDLKNKTLVYGFFLPIRNWKAGTPTIIGKVSANSVYQQTVVGVYASGKIINGYITTIP